MCSSTGARPSRVSFSCLKRGLWRGGGARGRIDIPRRGRITFADAEYNPQTGTFLVRATLPNPGALLRPGQFVRARLHGAMRPNAITVPQRAVQQGSQGPLRLGRSNEGKAEHRPVVVGDWVGNDWFITNGLQAGDRVVVDGGLALRPGEPVTVKAQAERRPPQAASPVTGSPQGKRLERPTPLRATKKGGPEPCSPGSS